MRPASGIQLIVGNRASVLVWSVGGEVLCSHTGGVLRRQETQRKTESTTGENSERQERRDRSRKRDRRQGGHGRKIITIEHDQDMIMIDR